jgi:hypothetical protein
MKTVYAMRQAAVEKSGKFQEFDRKKSEIPGRKQL